MDTSSYASFFTALLGAIVGGLFTLTGICLSLWIFDVIDISSYAVFFSALIGALIGGLFTLAGVCLSHKKIVEREDRKSILNLTSMLSAMNKEANLLIELGEDLFSSIENRDPKNIFFYFTEVTQDYFSIYDNNVHLLGQILGKENEEYKNSIITFYIRAKRFLETLASHSWYLDKYLEYTIYSNLTGVAVFQGLSKHCYSHLTNMNETLKESVSNLKSELDRFNCYHEEYIKQISVAR